MSRFAFIGGTALAVLSVSVPARSQTVVVPAGDSAREGNASFYYPTTSGLTFQELFAGSSLAGLHANTAIIGMQVRLDGGSVANAASTTPNFNVSLGTATGATLNTTFAANAGPDTALVRSGPLTFAGSSFPTGGTPNAFGPTVPFATPYVYTGGPLLLTVSYAAPSNQLVFDFDGSTSAVQYQQAASFQATVATYSVAGSLPIQFTYAAVPEPATAAAVLAGAVGLATRRRRRRRGVRAAG